MGLLESGLVNRSMQLDQPLNPLGSDLQLGQTVDTQNPFGLTLMDQGSKLELDTTTAGTKNAPSASGGAPAWAGHATKGCQGLASVLNGAASICGMIYQAKVANINHQIKKDTIENAREVSTIETEGMVDGLKGESAHNARMAELGKKALDAKEELYKAKGKESEIDHETKENKITEKMAATGDDKRMKMYFRNSPNYGSPVDQRYS